MKKAFIHTSIEVGDGSALDVRHNRFASTAAAIANIPAEKRYLGLIITVEVAGLTTEYWWKDLLTDGGLILKVGEPGATGPAGADSTVPGPTGPAGADSTVPGPTGPAGAGVAAGGTAKQRLQKVNGTDYNTEWVHDIEAYSFAVSDETSALTAGTAKVSFRMPHAFTLTAIRASLNEAATGSTLIINIKENGTTIFSTNLSIDAGELTSTTADTPAVISDASLADDALITVDIVQVGGTTAGKGLKISFIGYKS